MTPTGIKAVRRISASRIKLINDCTFRFWASEFLKIPEKTWPRTHVGSVVHGVLEPLAKPKRRALHDLVKKAGTIYVSPALSRLVRAWQYKTKIEPKLMKDIDPMVMLVLNETNFLDVGAIKVFEPEHEFDIILRNGGKVKGYIDRMAQYADKWIIWDYKSQKNKFETEEVLHNFQSLMYQLYVWKNFGILAEVRFVLLRHSPTKSKPTNHIQVTPPPTVEQLLGYELYLEYMWELVNKFTEADACSKFKTDDDGFCERVCSYYKPSYYVSIKKKNTNELVGNFMVDSAPQVKEDEWSETLYFEGCPRWNK